MKPIPYGHQFIDAHDIRAVVNTLKSDWITQGPKVLEFEQAICKYSTAKYAVAVSSGTAALHLACLALDIKPKDEIITSAITFAASANCILYSKGVPVFADIEENTANICISDLKKKITKRTKAIIPVHFAGQPCRLNEIHKLAKQYNLKVVEDAAHALGAEYKHSRIGSGKYSDMTILSFHPVKSITTAEGGAVLTNQREIYKKLLMLRNHGITKEASAKIKHQAPWYYEMRILGFNYRLSDIQSALGISQLKKINKFIARRTYIAKRYHQAFKGNPYFDLPQCQDYAQSAWHLYPLRLKDDYLNIKNIIFNKLRQKGILTQVHYLPVYLHPYYQNLGYPKGLCSKAEDFYRRALSIPIYPSLTNKDIDYVISNIYQVFGGR